jgi:WG containing repeat
VPIEFDKIELETEQAKAFKGEALSLFYLDEEGLLKEESNFKKHYTITIGKKRGIRRIPDRINLPDNDYTLNKFEWFYSSDEDKWGLRRLDDGTEQIKPTFDFIQVERNYGFTIVGIEQFEYYQFERTNYRFHMVFGMVNNDVGLLVTEVNLLDIRLNDFDKGHFSARVIFNNGRHGLVSRKPVGLMLKKDCAFIGDFHDGVARFSEKGRLSGSFKNKTYGLGNLSSYLNRMLTYNELVDYTLYDKEFQNDAEIICEDCTWGYIDTSGFVAVQPQFSFARDFVNEVGIAQFENKWGMVDASDRVLIPFRYDGIHFLENTGNKILRVYNNDRKYGLIDTLGRVTVNLKYDELGSFSEGRLAVKRNGLWGYVNKDGIEVIPCRFKFVKSFHNDLASVKLGNKWGAIDKQGDVVIDFQYTRLGNFKDGLAWAYTPKGAGYIDAQNNFVISPKFDKAFDFDNGVARVVIAGKYGLIDIKGKYKLTPQFSFISGFDGHNLAVVQIGHSRIRYKLINRSGNIITQRAFKKIKPFSEGMAAVKFKDRYGFINTKGRLVVSANYSKVSPFKEGRAAVKKEGLCGYINTDGEEVVALEFSKCLDFDDGKAVVYKGYKKGGLIDLNGKFIIEPSINRLYDFSDGRGLVRDANYQFYYITQQAKMYDGVYQKAGEFQHGIAVVQSTNNGQWGIVNQKGIEIIPPKYDKIEKFKDGYAQVRIKCFSGLTNLKGDLIVLPDYEYISYAGRGLFRVEQGDKIGYFDTRGNWVWGLSE